MQIHPKNVWNDLQTIKKDSPLIHNITNYVVMEQTANSLLAIGASPIMAHAQDEVEDIVKISNSLVLNIGTLSQQWIVAMIRALKAANAKGIPVLFDPVGVGATAYRTETAQTLLNSGKLAAIRGNASEIVSLTTNENLSKGVDTLLDAFENEAQAKVLAQNTQTVVWMSGNVDVITDGIQSVFVHNGSPLMGKITGMGCTATAISAAFLAVNKNPFLGCIHAAVLMGISGEITAKTNSGPGSFKMSFHDTLYNITLEQIESHLRYT